MFSTDEEFDDFCFGGDFTGVDYHTEHTPLQCHTRQSSPVEEERDKSWDVKLFHAVRGKAEDAIRGIEDALWNGADPNALCKENDGNSNLAWVLTSISMEPVRERVFQLLIRKGAVFTNDREQIETFTECATELRPGFFFNLMYSDLFNSVTRHHVMMVMNLLIYKQSTEMRNPEACSMMHNYILFAELIFYRQKEKMENQKNNDSDSDDEHSDDKEDECSTLDDFLSGIVDGETLLHVVVERCFNLGCCIPLLDILIDNGARLNVKDQNKRTPTELAKLIQEDNITNGERRVRDTSQREITVIAMLEEAEFRQEVEALEIERNKIELIAILCQGMMSKGSMFENVDADVICKILDEARK